MTQPLSAAPFLTSPRRRSPVLPAPLVATVHTALSDDLHSIYGPLFLTLLLAYVTARMFNGVVAMVISTVLQCYIADCEILDKEHRFAAGALRATIAKTRRDSASLKILPMDGNLEEEDGGGSADRKQQASASGEATSIEAVATKAHPKGGKASQGPAGAPQEAWTPKEGE